MRFITWGVIGATVFYIVKGVQNGTFQQVIKNKTNKLNQQNAHETEEPISRMTQHLQTVADNPLTGNFPTQNGI
ncbi:hypothetical protein FOH38_20005 [Lysinibacillus fusiformis]|nr:hypothetical protein FOH38_20005 [Lysinibacillus fusiformis]